jgi:hypothetical protein
MFEAMPSQTVPRGQIPVACGKDYIDKESHPFKRFLNSFLINKMAFGKMIGQTHCKVLLV